ncbi:serine/threonine-protein kinase [Paramagnetospirillum caucaseum]|nr:serine/threonine-protein kinase [Paramagnetospirillum caucaseum]
MATVDSGRIGKYEIIGELGRGAMGIVYQGRDPVIGRLVAIKTRKNDDGGADAEFAEAAERFKREAIAAGRLQHPNIVAVYEYGEDDGRAFIAMELVKGRTLAQYFQAGERFSTETMLSIMDQVLSALGHAHRQGIVHRDIKPSNILITEDGQAKIMDFGIARLESSTLTQIGTVMGSPSYMSPEQFTGEPVDARSDLYSAAVILYQGLTGEKAFAGDNLTAVMHRVLTTEPIPMTRLAAGIPPAIESVVVRGMARAPDQRFQTAKEFADALAMAATGKVAAPLAMPSAAGRAVSGDDPTVVTRGGDATLMAATIIGSTDDATIVVQHKRQGSRMPLIAAAVAGLTLAGAGGAYFLASSPKPPPAPAPAPAPASNPAKAGSDMDLEKELGEVRIKGGDAKPTAPAPAASTPVAGADADLEKELGEVKTKTSGATASAKPAATAAAPVLAVTGQLGDKPYPAGTPLTLSIAVTRPAWVTCYYRQASSTITRVFPNRFQPSGAAAPGKPLAVPNGKFKLVMDNAGQEERFICFATQSAPKVAEALHGKDLAPLDTTDLSSLVQAYQAAGAFGQGEYTVRIVR